MDISVIIYCYLLVVKFSGDDMPFYVQVITSTINKSIIGKISERKAIGTMLTEAIHQLLRSGNV